MRRRGFIAGLGGVRRREQKGLRYQALQSARVARKGAAVFGLVQAGLLSLERNYAHCQIASTLSVAALSPVYSQKLPSIAAPRRTAKNGAN